MIIVHRPTLLAAALAGLLTGCGATPLASLVAFGRVDPATTELAALRAAVIMPNALRPAPGTARIVLRAIAPDGPQEASFALEPDATGTATGILARPGSRITVFRLGREGIEAIEAFRGLAAARDARQITLGVAADACRSADMRDTAWPITALLRTSETGGFVVLARFDLRQLIGAAAIANIPACGPEAYSVIAADGFTGGSNHASKERLD